MKTDAPTIKCPHCELNYVPELADHLCPHPSKWTSPMLKLLRHEGAPYTNHAWARIMKPMEAE